ncbi:transposase [Brenneria populi]|uniref:Mutator family transposase n=1 Tax=Brenneria populi TaxID=1505588 RepID=A0ABU6JR07_9GAMM|nr:transposase [Brenneria populi Li et al. 2015]
MSQPFDFDKALKALQSGQSLTGKDGILTPLIKQLTESALFAELDSHLAQDVDANRKNGSDKKTIKATTGSFGLATPRDRNGTFEPQLVKKHQTTLSDEIEHKIIRLFALGMSYADISREIEDLYAFSVSTATISAVTDKVIPELKYWQQRPLEPVYPFVWLDAIHYKIRGDGRYVSKAAETALDELDAKWGQQYPMVIQSWRRKWENLSAYFRYPADIRKVIYTTNAIESVHRQFRKLTKTKGAFPNENSLLKLLYLGRMNAQEKWTMPIQNWNLTLSQLAIYFDGRLNNVITL